MPHPTHLTPERRTFMTIKLLQTLINFEEDALAYYYNSGASLEFNHADADEIYANYLFQIYPNEIQNIYNVLEHLAQEEQQD